MPQNNWGQSNQLSNSLGMKEFLWILKKKKPKNIVSSILLLIILYKPIKNLSLFFV